MYSYHIYIYKFTYFVSPPSKYPSIQNHEWPQMCVDMLKFPISTMCFIDF